MPVVSRILDANANRAREALRTMEEAARFLLNDAVLSADLKQLRHDFAAALAGLPDLALTRDTPGDVGTAITTSAEGSRGSVADVAAAAGRRLTEALRALEEYGKLLPTPPAIEPLRYRAYEIERRLSLALQPGLPRQWRLCLLLTESLCRKPWAEVLEAAVDHGVDCVQVREKDLEAGPLLARVRDVMARVGDRTTVIVNDRPDVAAAAGAHGVHLGQGDLPCAEVRKQFGRQLIVGVSTSHLDEARSAPADDGADYCGVGPMFPTTTKHKPVLVGPDYLKAYVAWAGEVSPANGLSHLAIGGIHAGNLSELLHDAGVRGIAVSSAICSADDPAAATRTLLAALPDGSAEPD